MKTYTQRIAELYRLHEELITRTNIPQETSNGIFTRYKYPVLTAAHTPVFWRYDLDENSNPYLMERIGMNATMNSGAIKWNDKYLLVVRVEGADRKSFFAIAESPNGIDNFRFWDYPITMPEDIIPATNVYDMRLTAHEDGWIYGLFCAERHDDTAPGRFVFCNGNGSYCPYQRFEDLGAPAGFENQKPAAQCSTSSGICRW